MEFICRVLSSEYICIYISYNYCMLSTSLFREQPFQEHTVVLNYIYILVYFTVSSTVLEELVTSHLLLYIIYIYNVLLFCCSINISNACRVLLSTDTATTYSKMWQL